MTSEAHRVCGGSSGQVGHPVYAFPSTAVAGQGTERLSELRLSDESPSREVAAMTETPDQIRARIEERFARVARSPHERQPFLIQ